MSEEEENDPVALSWRVLEMQQRLGHVPAGALKAARLPTTSVVCEDEHGNQHVCSDECFHLQPNPGDDRFVCPISGYMWGQQISNGNFNPQNCVDHPNQGIAHGRRTAGHSRPPVRDMVDKRAELMSAAIATLNKLLHSGQREAVDANREAKALKSALRVEASLVRSAREKKQPVMMCSVLFEALSELERATGGGRKRTEDEDRIQNLACRFVEVHERFVIPYNAVVGRKPTNIYFVAACMYLFAKGIGETYHDAYLATHNPDRKVLKTFGMTTSRVKSAERFIKDAMQHTVSH